MALAQVSCSMSVSYFKRFRMEIDLRGRRLDSAVASARLSAGRLDTRNDSAPTRKRSTTASATRSTPTSSTASAISTAATGLMHEISLKDGFLPEATWLAAYVAGGEMEYCGTIQGIRATSKYGGDSKRRHHAGASRTRRRHGAVDRRAAGLSASRAAAGLSRSDRPERTGRAPVQAAGLPAHQDAVQGRRAGLFLTLATSRECTVGWVESRVLDHSYRQISRASRVRRNSFSYLGERLVLVGEPTRSMESAAFTFLLPGGCAYDPPGGAGLAALTSEMMQRGAGPRDSRAWISELENLGVERGESVGVAQATFHGATLRDNLPAALELFADLIPPATFAGRSIRSGPQHVPAGVAGDRR